MKGKSMKLLLIFIFVIIFVVLFYQFSSFTDSKKFTFLQFDTLIIHKSFRKIKLANLLMAFNNITIINKKLSAQLNCKKKLILFYKKFGWKISNNKYLIPKKKNKAVMVFN